MTAALLPPNATDMERALAEVVGEALTVPVQIETLWNPWTCPEPLLPWLAWAMSVPVWENDWPQQTKRQVIATSFETHATKGTRASLLRALEPFGLTSELVEWWEAGGSGVPYTFDLTSWINRGAPATTKVQQGLASMVTATAPVRAHMTGFRIGARFQSQGALAGAAAAHDAATLNTQASGRCGFRHTSRTSSAMRVAESTARNGSTAGRNRVAASMLAATAIGCTALTATHAEARGRRSLSTEGATSHALASHQLTSLSGPATGRHRLAAAACDAGVLASLTINQFEFSDGEPTVARSYFIRRPGCPEAEITMHGPTLVARVEGKTYRLAGAPLELDLKPVGVCDAAVDAADIVFSAPPTDVQAGDLLILGSHAGRILSVSGTTITIDRPTTEAVSGIQAYRLRDA